MSDVSGAYDGSAAKTKAVIVYGLYLLALLGGLTGVVGLVMAYVFKSDAPDWLQSHYSFMIRTFWIGFLYYVISGVLCFVLIGFPLLFATTVWWIVRCVQGLDLATKNRPVPRPQSWLFT